jgi:CubicO group peptidase (beta-lactamase class C family)
VRAPTVEALQIRLAREQSEQRLPSIVAGVLRGGELVWAGGAGDVGGDPADVQYRCGSITKTFVAVQVMRLRDEGHLALTDPLERHIPGAFDGVTIAQLLSHASGLRAETAGPWWERTAGGDFTSLVASSLQPSDVAPGEGPVRLTRPGQRFHYTNVGFALLGEVVSRLRGLPWADALTQDVLDPLGLRRTTMRPEAPHAIGYAVHPFADVLLAEPEHDAGAMAPAGQLWMSITDLARWTAFLRDGRGGAAVLSSDTLEEMREPLALDDRRGVPWTGAHGLGIQIWNADGVRSFGHGGSMPGFLAMMRMEAESGEGAVVMANATSGMRATIGEELSRILADHEPLPVAPWTPAHPPAATLAALGRWFWGTSAFTLRTIGSGELALQPEPMSGRAARFLPNPDGSWTGQDGYFAGETLRIRWGGREGTGEPVALDLASFLFTRTPYDPKAGVPGGVDERGWFVPSGD